MPNFRDLVKTRRDFIRNKCSPPGYIFLDETRGHWEGGSMEMICRDIYKPLKLSSGIGKFFEFSDCKIQLGNSNICVLVVYRILNSSVTSSEFDRFLEPLLITSDKLLIYGDFNIHINKRDCVNSKKFRDCWNVKD